jgi:hypothetical protein
MEENITPKIPTEFEKQADVLQVKDDIDVIPGRRKPSRMKDILNDYMRKYSKQSSKNSQYRSKTEKHLNLDEMERVTPKCRNKTAIIKKSGFFDFPGNSTGVADSDKVIVKITHNTQNNISIINSGQNKRNTPKSAINLTKVLYPILRKRAGGSNTQVSKRKAQKVCIAVKKSPNTCIELNDPNYIDSPKEEVSSPNCGVYLSETKKDTDISVDSVNSMNCDDFIKIIENIKYPVVVDENIGSGISGLSAITFKNFKYIDVLI